MLLHELFEKEDMTAIPEDVMRDLKKSITKGASDLKQLWANALELVHKAFEVNKVERPDPSMTQAWKQYEELLQYAVNQLGKYRGMDGDWRMSSSELHP